MTLKDLLTADIGDVFLSTDDFGESAEYFPASGAKRTITVVPVDEQRRRYEPTQHQEYNVRSIMTFSRKNVTTGIDAPARGDVLKLFDRLFSFDEIVEEDNDSITIRWRGAAHHSSGTPTIP